MRNACAGLFGVAYDFWIERERVAQLVGPFLWGIDTRPMYASMRREIGGTAPGQTIVDVPCGGGVAFRALSPSRRVRYIAVDLDRKMRSLPLADGVADLGLSYSGLHVIAEPEVAVAELGRCVRPGGRVAGSTFLGDGNRRQRVVFTLGERTGHAAPKGTAADLEGWLTDAGIVDCEVHPRRGFVLFRGRRSAE